METFNPAEDRLYKYILPILAASLFDRPLPDFIFTDQDIPWQDIIRELQLQTIISVPKHIIGSLPLDPKSRADWTNLIIRDTVVKTNIKAVQDELTKLLDDAGIPLAILKGYAAASYYPDPTMRTMGDIDFIVHPEDFDRTKEVLIQSGFVIDDGHDTYRHIGFSKNTVELELHRYFAATETKPTDIKVNKIVDEAISTNKDSNGTPMLTDEANCIVLLDHITHHISEGIGLRQLIDFITYANKINNIMWSEVLKSLTNETGLEKLAICVFEIGKSYFGLDLNIVLDEAANLELSNQLICISIKHGNFGRKENYGNRSVKAVMNNSFGNIITRLKYLQSAGERNWNAYKNHPFLKPFAWIYQGGRYIKKAKKAGITFKDIINNKKASDNQSDIFSKLGLAKNALEDRNTND